MAIPRSRREGKEFFVAGTGKLFIDPPENSKQHVADPPSSGCCGPPIFPGGHLSRFCALLHDYKNNRYNTDNKARTTPKTGQKNPLHVSSRKRRKIEKSA